MTKYVLAIFVLMLFTFSCVNKNRPEKVEMKSSEQENQSVNQGSDLLKLAEFTMTIPNSWEKAQPSSEMRMLEFKVPEAKSNIAGFYFGPREEMVEANINRWRGQFVDVESFDRETYDEGQIFVRITGTYKKKPNPMAQDFTEAPGYETLATIVPSNKGPYFFKLVGEKENVEKVEDEFIAFIKSYSKN